MGCLGMLEDVAAAEVAAVVEGGGAAVVSSSSVISCGQNKKADKLPAFLNPSRKFVYMRGANKKCHEPLRQPISECGWRIFVSCAFDFIVSIHSRY
jgi:hypothetical protein